MIIQDDITWSLQVDVENMKEINILQNEQYEGYDLKVVFKNSICFCDFVLATLNKFYSVVVYFDYDFEVEREDINSFMYIKEMQRLGFELNFKDGEEGWKPYEFSIRYRVLPSFLLIRTNDAIITLISNDTIDFFNRTLNPILYSELSDAEKDDAKLLIEQGVLKRYGDYIFNISIKVRRNVNYDWK